MAADTVSLQAGKNVIDRAIGPVSSMCGMAMTCCTSTGLLVLHKPVYQIKGDEFMQCVQ